MIAFHKDYPEEVSSKKMTISFLLSLCFMNVTFCDV